MKLWSTLVTKYIVKNRCHEIYDLYFYNHILNNHNVLKTAVYMVIRSLGKYTLCSTAVIRFVLIFLSNLLTAKFLLC